MFDKHFTQTKTKKLGRRANGIDEIMCTHRFVKRHRQAVSSPELSALSLIIWSDFEQKCVFFKFEAFFFVYLYYF